MDFPHAAFTDDEFLGRAATWLPNVLVAGFVSDSAIAGFVSDPATGPGFLADSGTSVRITFSLGVEDVNLGGEIVPQGSVAQAGCDATSVPGLKNKDVFVVDGVVYRVLRSDPDETGWVTIYLGKRY